MNNYKVAAACKHAYGKNYLRWLFRHILKCKKAAVYQKNNLEHIAFENL